MSTSTDFFKVVSTPPTVEELAVDSGRFESLIQLVTRFSPVQDWVSLGILIYMMANVGWSVQLAGWGDLPSVIPTLLLGTITAFVVSKLNFDWYLTVVYALCIGFFVVMWQGTAQAAGADPISKSIDGFERFSSWITTAQSGGISTDTVPFALMFMAASWIVGYGVTAITFRFRSPWLPTILLSLLILTNLSYRHGEYEHTFFLFLVGGIALFAHLTTVRRIERWRAQGITYSKKLAWATVQDGLLFALPIVLISAVLPIWEPRSDRVHDVWDIFRAPFYALQEPANRLLAGVDGPGNKALFSTPSQTMAFGGSLELTDEPLMWVRSKYVVPYAGRVYQKYSSEGWLTDSNTKVEAPPRSALNLAPNELERERVSQIYVPFVDTKTVVPAGGVFSVDRKSTVQILNPMRWDVPLTGSVAQISALPSDLRDISFAVRFALNDLVSVESFGQRRLNSQNLVEPELVEEVLLALQAADTTGEEQVITRTVVDESGDVEKFETIVVGISNGDRSVDWDQINVTVDTDFESGLARRLSIKRNSPIEQVGVQLSSEISKDDTFSIQTFVSLATDDQLNDAGTNYPTWISDRYLQLPRSLPEEVGLLASQIIRDAGAVTPFEKAEAIKSFLKQQEYSLEISGPEFGVDGIYYFLFQTQNEPCASVDQNCDTSKVKGYSQYFGSSAAVLLRSVGVPARFVAGWAAGEYMSDAGMFLVRDKDRHGWTQVFFPEYGWIDYEVTPGKSTLERGRLSPTVGGGDSFAAGGIGSAEDDPDFLLYMADLERLARESRAANGELLVQDDAPIVDGIVIPQWVFAWASGVVAAVALAMFAWWLSLRGMDAPTKAYARMLRLSSLLGMKRKPTQTALEFASELGDKTVAARDHATFIAIEFQRQIYAGASQETGEDEEREKDINEAWRKVARALIAHRIRRLGGISP